MSNQHTPPNCHYCGQFVNPSSIKEVAKRTIYGMFSVDTEIFYHVECHMLYSEKLKVMEENFGGGGNA